MAQMLTRSMPQQAPAQQPVPQQQLTDLFAGFPSIYGNDQQNWQSYLQQAQAATQGINNMPWVLDDFQNIPENGGMALFQEPQQQQAPDMNPLLWQELDKLRGQIRRMGSPSGPTRNASTK